MRSFIGIPYTWRPAMTNVLGKTMEVLQLREGGQLVGLEEAENESGQPIWFYSRSAVRLVQRQTLSARGELSSSLPSCASSPSAQKFEALVPCMSRTPVLGDKVKMLSGEFGKIPPFINAMGKEVV